MAADDYEISDIEEGGSAPTTPSSPPYFAAKTSGEFKASTVNDLK